jgi:DNA-binding IclR family transcriptional regulator
MDLRREALPYMTELARRLGETCDLSVYDRGEVFYIEVVQGNHTLTISAAVGRSLPAHCTASGKVLLAHLSPEALDLALSQPLPAYTDRTIIRPEALRKELEAVRSQGIASDDEEFEVGIRAVSAPIRDREGKVIAAMSVASPTSRMTMERMPVVAEDLRGVADMVSHRLGWHPQ